VENIEIVKGNAALEALQQKLGALKGRAESLIVKDQETCIVAKQLKLDIQAYQKAVKFQTGPDIEIKKEELRALQSQEKMLLAPAETILEISERKRRDWENEERRLAEEETRRENEERTIRAEAKAKAEREERERIAAEQRRNAELIAAQERREREKAADAARKAGEIGKREAERQKREAEEKAAEARKAAAEAEARERERAAQDAKLAVDNVPKVIVKPNIPAVAGTVSRRNWKFKVVDAAKLRREYLMPDEVKIGEDVRRIKDKDKAEAECPGIEVWAE
jgi:hypothetical protein